MKTKFDWGDDMIDSRDLIARHEDLQDEYDGLVSDLKDVNEAYVEYQDKCAGAVEFDQEEFDNDVDDLQKNIDEAQEALDQFNQSYEKDELDTLTEVISQGEDSPDWNHGEGLIHESYFETYTQDLIDDTCELPKELNSGQWPYRHYELDLTAASEELKADYMTIDAGGHTYYIRA